MECTRSKAARLCSSVGLSGKVAAIVWSWWGGVRAGSAGGGLGEAGEARKDLRACPTYQRPRVAAQFVLVRGTGPVRLGDAVVGGQRLPAAGGRSAILLRSARGQRRAPTAGARRRCAEPCRGPALRSACPAWRRRTGARSPPASPARPLRPRRRACTRRRRCRRRGSSRRRSRAATWCASARGTLWASGLGSGRKRSGSEDPTLLT